MKRDTIEIGMATILLILSLAVINPGNIWMPDMTATVAAGILFVLFSFFAAFIWRAKPSDEREQLHKLIASQHVFLVGAGVLSLGIVIESIRHTADPWLATALCAMMLTKTASLMWARKKK